MTRFAPIEAAPAPAPPRQQHRAPVRVDPASLASKKRQQAEVRTSDPPREDYDTEEREPAGQYVDIDV